MLARKGIAYCPDTFSERGCPPRIICAAPIFMPTAVVPGNLPLQDLYNHPDFVDLINAQEFGLEYTAYNGGTLLCIVAATTFEGLTELIDMIEKTAGIYTLLASCKKTDGNLCVQLEDGYYTVPAELEASNFLVSAQEKHFPLPALLAALTVWCTGYETILYWEKQS